MSENVIITADSTCDLPKALIEKYDIKITPLSIMLGDEIHYDGVDCFPNDLYSYVDKTGELPKTAAVPPSTYEDLFTSLIDEGSSVVHIGLSSAISSSYNNSCIAAEELDNVYCVDSKSLCTAMGLLVLKACDLREEGFTAKQIYNRLNDLVPKVSTTFVIDKLDYLYKGGRCSGVARFSANVLGIRPSIAVDSKVGSLDVAKKYRGKLEAVYKQYINDSLSNIKEVDPARIVIANSGGVSDDVLKLAESMVKEKGIFKEIIFADAGCTISSHCGPKTLAIFYINE